MLNYKLPNGQYLIPSANPSFTPTLNFPENVFITQPAYFITDQAVSDLDYLVSSKDTLALKYYYQHDPTTAPFGFSSVQGFPQHLDAGSQVASITNTQSITPNFSITEVFGFIREKVYSTIGQPFTPQAMGINAFGSTVFPGITIVDDLGNASPTANTNFVFNAGLNIGSTAASQGAFTGIFQNRWMPSANAIWNHGKHTITFGGSFSYTQLNARDRRTNTGIDRLHQFRQFPHGHSHHLYREWIHCHDILAGRCQPLLPLEGKRRYTCRTSFSSAPISASASGLRFDYHGGSNGKVRQTLQF